MKITNGYGKEINLNYQSIITSYSSINTKNVSSLYNYRSPNTFLIKSSWLEDDLDKKEYLYFDPIVHVKGKGFLGFKKNIVKNIATGIEWINKFEIKKNNNLYYALFPTETIIKIGDKDLLKSMINYSVFSPYANFPKIFIPYLQQEYTQTWENDFAHTFIKTQKRYIYDIDTYGNVKGEMILTDDANLSINANDNQYQFHSKTDATYLPFPIAEPWLVNRVETKTIFTKLYENQLLKGEDKSLQEFNYYDDNNKPWQLYSTIFTPNDNSQLALTNQFESYDNYGNLTKKITKASTTSPYNDIPNIEDIYEYVDVNNPNYFHRFLVKKYQKYDGILKDNSTKEFSYNAINGNLISEKDYLNNITHYEYDLFGYLVKTILPNGVINQTLRRWSENYENNPIKGVYLVWSQTSGEKPVKVFYNQYGKELRTISSGFGESQFIVNDKEYDNRGLLYKAYDPYLLGTGDNVPYTRFQYDNLDRVRFEVYFDGDNNTVRTKEIGYMGLQTYLTINRETSDEIIKLNTKNAIGQIISVDDQASIIFYNYYASGKVEEMTVKGDDEAQGNTTSFTYDDLGNQLTLTSPGSGLSSTQYDAYGRLRESIDENGNHATYLYDNQGRINELEIDPGSNSYGGSINTSYEYFEDPSQDGFGQLKKVINNSNAIYNEFSYDSYGRRIAALEHIDDNHEYSNYYSYDIFGRLKETTLPSGLKTRNIYKSSGILWKILNSTDNNSRLWQLQDMNERGQPTAFTLGNNITSTWEYDNFGILENIITDNGLIQNMEYVFNQRTTNLISRKDLSNGNNIEEVFDYDQKLHERLISWKVSTLPEYTINFSDNGNILSKSDIAPNNNSYKYINQNPYAVTQIENVNQNYQTHAGINKQLLYHYNALQKTYSVEFEDDKKVEFIYGPIGNRKIMRTYVWNEGINDWELEKMKYYAFGNMEIEEKVNGDVRQLQFIGNFAVQEKVNNMEAEFYYLHNDYLGSTQAITMEDGSLKQLLNFDPWGRRRDKDNWSYTIDDEQPYFDRGYTGHEHLDDFGLINMNGRMYDPWVGKFLSPDPVIKQVANSQNFNRYSYALNNPFKYTDPSGYTHKPIGWNQAPSVNYEAMEALGGEGGSGYGTVSAFDVINHKTGSKYRSNVGYVYSWKKGKYLYRGEEVSYEEVFNNYIIPNSETFHVWHDYAGTESNPYMIDKGYSFTRASSFSSCRPYNVTSLERINQINDIPEWMNKLNIGLSSYMLPHNVKMTILGAVKYGKLGAKYFAMYSKIGIFGSIAGVGISGYSIYNSVSQGHAANAWDVADAFIGVAGISSSILLSYALISNPVGWTVGLGVGLYFAGRFFYEISTKP